jgi:hypothetical protein
LVSEFPSFQLGTMVNSYFTLNKFGVTPWDASSGLRMIYRKNNLFFQIVDVVLATLAVLVTFGTVAALAQTANTVSH